MGIGNYIGKINFPSTADLRKDFVMYKVELERRLNFTLNNIKGNTVSVVKIDDNSTISIGQQGLIECNKATDMILNLPTAVGNTGVAYFITNINTGTVTIEPLGSETLQGDINFDLYEDENLNIISNGTNWTVGG